MFINQPVLKSNKKKPKTIAKSINQYQFSSPKQAKQQQQLSSSPNQNNKKSKISERRGILKNKKSRLFGSAAVSNNNGINGGSGGIVGKQGQRQASPLPYNQLLKQQQFEGNLEDQLEKLLQKWQKNLSTIQNNLIPYQNVKQTQAQIKAFEHCTQILTTQFNIAQDTHQQQTNFIEKKQLQIDDYKLRLIKQIKQLKDQNNLLREQKEKFVEQQKQRDKKVANKNAAQDKINTQKQRIQKLRKMLLQCKQKSYEQKNQFIEIQAQQFKIQAQIRQIQQQQQKYQQQLIRKQKYDQLLKIKQKVLNSKNNIEEEIKPHLQRKIEKMAKLRAEMGTIDEALDVCFAKIEDQNIIIQALKQKCYHEEAHRNQNGGSQNLFNNYYKRYSQIYFGDNKSNSSKDQKSNVWRDYSLYLKHLVDRSKNLNKRVHSQIPTSNSKDSYNQILDLRPKISKRNTGDKFFGDSTKISTNPTKYQKAGDNMYKKPSSNSTKFPKIVKIQGQPNQQPNIKKKVIDGIIKANNKQEPFQLQSINSSDSKVSGEIIQVQFHKK